MLDPKESVSVPTRVPHPEDDDVACRTLAEEVTLSWIVADPARPRAADLSSRRPVSVRRHWLSGEVEVKFAAVLTGIKKRGPTEYVEFAIVVTCARAEEGGGMQVREVSLRVEDMEGTQVTGKDGLVILQRALEGKRGKIAMVEEEGKRRYEDYLERKKERKERRARAEKRMDRMCVAIGASILAAFCLLFICT